MIEWDIQVSLRVPDDPDSLITEICAIGGVAEIQYFGDASEVYPPPPVEREGVDTTVRGDTPPPPETPVLALLFLWLEEGTDPEVIAAQLNSMDDLSRVSYSPEIGAQRAAALFDGATEGATVLGEDPLVLQPAPGPAPRFDPSPLGREILLEPAQPGDDIVDRTRCASDGRWRPARTVC